MLKQKNKTLVVVTDRKEASFYTKQPNNKLVKLDHEIKAKPIRTDINTRRTMGRTFKSGSSARHVIEPHTDDATQEMIEFVREVTKYLEASFTKQEFNQLILAASPKVLGQLRKKLSTQLKKCIVLECDKDLGHLPLEKIEAQLKSIAKE